MWLTRINDVGRAEEQHLRTGRERQEKEETPYKLPSLYFKLVAGLTNKSNDKICILVTLLSPLLDPGLRIRRPFHVAPYLCYSHSRRLSSHHFSLFLRLPLLNPDSDHEFSNPFHQSTKEAESTWEKHREFSDGAAKKSREPSKCRKHIDRIRKRLDSSKDASCRQKLNYNVRVCKI